MQPPWQLDLMRVEPLESRLIRTLCGDLARYLAGEVRIASRVLDPSPAFDPARGQYSAIAILSALLDPPPGPGVRRIAVASVDLFLPVFTHVFGSAQLDGPVGVTSVRRLRPEFSGGPSDAGCLRERVFKEVLHELGHTFGLRHCRVPWCAMAASTLPEQIDLKDPGYCPKCGQSVGVKYADGLLAVPR